MLNIFKCARHSNTARSRACSACQRSRETFPRDNRSNLDLGGFDLVKRPRESILRLTGHPRARWHSSIATRSHLRRRQAEQQKVVSNLVSSNQNSIELHFTNIFEFQGEVLPRGSIASARALRSPTRDSGNSRSLMHTTLSWGQRLQALIFCGSGRERPRTSTAQHVVVVAPRSCSRPPRLPVFAREALGKAVDCRRPIVRHLPVITVTYPSE